jgi:hypothetical protein
MIRDVHPGSGFFTHPRSQIQGSKRHWIPDPQHCIVPEGTVYPDPEPSGYDLLERKISEG